MVESIPFVVFYRGIISGNEAVEAIRVVGICGGTEDRFEWVSDFGGAISISGFRFQPSTGVPEWVVLGKMAMG